MWQTIDRLRENADWPSWCFVPMANIFPSAAASWHRRPDPVALAADVARLAGLAAWRVTQGIYRFDPDVYRAVTTTPPGRLPAEVLTLLPEWGVYVEMQNMPETAGFFAHCEYDPRTGTPELRLLLDTPTGLQPVAIPLTGGSLTDAADSIAPGYGTVVSTRCADCIGLLLYMCSITADFGHYTAQRPEPVRTKRGLRLFPPDAPVIVAAGERPGKILRASQGGDSLSHDVTGRSVAPHLRRAHWHGYWSGNPRKFSIRWMHPILVNAAEASPAEIRVSCP